MAESFPLRNKKIWVAGHAGMVGSAVVRRLQREDCRILKARRAELDLTRQRDVEDWMAANRPDAVVLAAARVGGIKANSDFPADFLYDNLAISANIIHAAYRLGVKKLLFLGSSCIYPREAVQPIRPEALLTGPLEKTNEAYAIAKIAAVKLCAAYRAQHGCDFISVMPCNLYGPGDTYDADNAHVIPALIMKMDRAKREKSSSVTLWGTGKPLREFLYVDDLAEGLVELLKNYSGLEPVNIGSGEEITIASLAARVAAAVGYKGRIIFDSAMPDGTPRKILDSSRIMHMGWRPETGLETGLRRAYDDFRERFCHADAA